MENNIILLDTSILIDYYRKKDKKKTALFHLAEKWPLFAVSAVTHFEIYVGVAEQKSFWDSFFQEVSILPFNAEISLLAATIDKHLKKARQQLAIPDLFIAATALSNNLPCATLNRKHFSRIPNLQIIEL